LCVANVKPVKGLQKGTFAPVAKAYWRAKKEDNNLLLIFLRMAHINNLLWNKALGNKTAPIDWAVLF
jgi:hypothetical protein